MVAELDAVDRERDQPHCSDAGAAIHPQAAANDDQVGVALVARSEGGVMRSDRSELFLLLTVVAGSEAVAWYKYPDPLVAFYVFIFILLALTKIFDWPKPSWFGGQRISLLHEKWGAKPVGKRYNSNDRLMTLNNDLAARTFFMTAIYKDNTEKLCNSVNESMTVKSVAAAFTMLGTMATTDPTADYTSFQYLFKLAAVSSAAVIAIVWDFARCEKQKYWNREIREP